MPDASLSAEAGGVGITLSQWALTKRQAIRGQSRWVRAALSGLGVPDVDIVLESACRSDRRDDHGLLVNAVRSHVERLRRRSGRP